ncbi:MAG TPA: Fic family protein [Methanocorpusculum sp.]|nr:Fic family protein [Methanocorpusculum sp.]
MSAYIIEALSDEAIYSSKLEGAVTTELAAKNMLRKNIPPKTKDEQMIVNNHHAIQFIRDKKDILLTPEFLCELQRIVTTDTLKDEHQSGTFRTTDDVAVVEGRSGKVVHYPPKSAELPALIQAVCDLANRDRKNSPADSFVHPIIVGIALHFLIGYIHPFYDGNGRTARTLFYWYVLSRGYRLFEYIAISKIITQAPAQYRNAYTATEEDAMDLTYFIRYNVHCIQKAREKLTEYLHCEQKRMGAVEVRIAALPDLTKRQGQILRYMLEYPDEEFSIREITDRFSVAYQTARTDLMHLDARRYVQMKKRGKAQYYRVNTEHPFARQ